MDKFLDRFKPKPKANNSNNKKNVGGGGGFKLSLPGGQGNKFQGQGAKLGGSKPGKVIEVTLEDPGPLGIKVERSRAGTAFVGNVEPGSQAEKAGLERGDVCCFQGSDGQEEIPFDLFLELAKANQRPLCFEIRRVQTKSTASSDNATKTAESFSRKQAVIAAAEKREKEAKALNKKSKEKKALPNLLSTEEQRKIEEERLAQMDAAVENQSEAAKEAVAAAKRNEANTAAALGYNPYETNKVTAGQARNATVAATHGTVENTGSNDASNNNASAMAPLPTVRPPTDPSATSNGGANQTTKSAPVSSEFSRAYEIVVTSNDHAAVVASFGILRKLIVNATTKGQQEDESQASKFRRVRLGNAKIKAAIVEIEGAFDLMSAVGFQLVEEDGESFLAYPKGPIHGKEWLDTALSTMESYEKA